MILHILNQQLSQTLDNILSDQFLTQTICLTASCQSHINHGLVCYLLVSVEIQVSSNNVYDTSQLFFFFLFLKKNGNDFQVNEFLSSQEGTAKQKMTTEEVAMGFIQVANEAMCRPIRALTQVRQFTCLTPISRKFCYM